MKRSRIILWAVLLSIMVSTALGYCDHQSCEISVEYDLHFRTADSTITDVLLSASSNLDRIPAKVFKAFPKVEKLSVAHTGLKEIYREDFILAVNVKHLNLSCNNIEFLERRILVNLEKLTILDLSRNKINRIDEKAFDESSVKLTHIDFSENRLKVLQYSHLLIFDQKSVNFAKNQIESIEGVPTLVSYSGHFGINYFLQPVLTNRHSITFLKQAVMTNQHSITSLNLDDNLMKSFDSHGLDIGELSLRNNAMETLKLHPSTKILYVDNNKLTELSITASMTHVSAKNNKIEDLKCNTNLALESLNLSQNKIINKMLVPLKTADKLRELDLSDTTLNGLQSDTFAEMTLLEELDLSNSSMGNISYGLFTHQKSLTSLNISYNNLEEIDYLMFASLKNLTTWDISGNKLTKLDDHKNFRKMLPQLSTIGIENNYWDCVYLTQLLHSMTEQGIKIKSPANPVKNESSVEKIKCSPPGSKVFSRTDKQISKSDTDIKPEPKAGPGSSTIVVAAIVILIVAFLTVSIIFNASKIKSILRSTQTLRNLPENLGNNDL